MPAAKSSTSSSTKYCLILCAVLFICWLYYGRKSSESSDVSKFTMQPEDEDRTLLSKAKQSISNVKYETKHVTVMDMKVYYLESAPEKPKADILLLHGIAANMDGTADVWLDVSTLQLFVADGYRVIAPDLPGTPKSRTSSNAIPDDKKADFVKEFMSQAKVEKAIIYGASWGGSFSIPLLVKYPELFKSFVAVCPVASDWFSAKQYKEIEVPTLVIYGESDYELGVKSYENLKSLPKSKRVVVPNVGHRVFQEQPDPFHAACLNYMQSIL